MRSKAPAGVLDYSLLLGLAGLWGSSFIFIEMTVADVPALTQTAYRVLIASLVSWAAFFVFPAALPKGWHIWGLIMLSSISGVALPFSLIAWGQKEVSPGVTAVLIAIMPLATLVFAHFFTSDEKFSLPKLIGIGFGIAGVIVLVGPAVLKDLGGNLWYQGAILLAACGYAMNAVVTKFLTNVDKLVLVMLRVTWAFVVVAPAAYLQNGPFHLEYSATALVAIVILGVFHTVLGGVILVILVERQGAGFFSQINLLVPLFGVLWAFLIFSEPPTINTGFALILILTGVGVARGKFTKL